MSALSKNTLYKIIGVPAFVFTACIAIAFSTKFATNPDQLSLPLLGDLLITAPLAYYLVIRRTTVSKLTVLRVFMAGIILAGMLLSNHHTITYTIIKTWISPVVEMTLIGFMAWKFYQANKKVKALGLPKQDFLTHCRSILGAVSGSEKLANVFASEIAVFYYIFSRKDKGIDYTTKFTCYKENGVVMVLGTILFLFLLETAGMHILFLLWSKTAAWILTSLSLYTCLQLFAHIKALQARPIVITDHHLLLRNGLMGGDASVPIANIEKALLTSKALQEKDAVKLALLKSFEKPTVALYVHQPVIVLKAFGIRKTANVVLVSVDKPKAFLQALENARK